jgi:rRNA-processing protein EBP2
MKKKVEEGSGSDSEEEEGCDEDNMDEASMNRIIELLGDDGLDEFAQYQLEVLGEQGSEEEGDYSDVQEYSGSENEATDESISSSKEGEVIRDDEEENINVTEDVLDAEVDVEDLSEVDEDTVPRQRLEYMNTVRAFISVGWQWA